MRILHSLVQFWQRARQRWHSWWLAWEERWMDWREAPAWVWVLVASGAVALAFGGYWAYRQYPGWRAARALQLAERLVDGADLESARLASLRALQLNPGRVEAWRCQARVGERVGDPLALLYWQHAAQMVPESVELQLALARAALVAGNLETAGGALARIAPAVAAGSADFQLYAGELARQQLRFDEAEAAFRRSVALRPGAPEGEVALGSVLVAARDPALRGQGVALLDKWRRDPAWELSALRGLLAAAVVGGDPAQINELATAVQAHPQALPQDRVSAWDAWLLADPRQAEASLSAVRSRATRDGPLAAMLVGWYCRHGRAQEGAAWGEGLEAPLPQTPPLVTALADAYRVEGNWPQLAAWTQTGDWGDADTLRLLYSILAAQKTGDRGRAAQTWAEVRRRLRDQPARAHFFAGLVYPWGLTEEAVELWWESSEDPQWGLLAGGALARHYQVQRDATGLAKAFYRLQTLLPTDDRLANNFAYMAVLADFQAETGLAMAERNHARHPDNVDYTSTWAFVLWRRGRTTEAADLVQSLLPQTQAHPNLRFTCGLVLAATGRRTEAAALLRPINPASLTTREVELLQEALGTL